MIRVLALLLLLAGVAAAQPQIFGPTEYPAHGLVRLKVVNVPDKTGFLWKVHPLAGVQKADTAKDVLQFAAPPGVYSIEVILFSIDKDGNPLLESVATQVVISGNAPTPPPVPPPPGPTPPGPTPPVPDDLTREIKLLYDADTGQNKQKVAKQLATLYRWGAEQVFDKQISTTGNLDAALFLRSRQYVENGLDLVRQRVADKCAAVLGGNKDPKLLLDDDKRKALSDLFLKLARAMDEVAR